MAATDGDADMGKGRQQGQHTPGTSYQADDIVRSVTPKHPAPWHFHQNGCVYDANGHEIGGLRFVNSIAIEQIVAAMNSAPSLLAERDALRAQVAGLRAASGVFAECSRSHPHELMTPLCDLRTVIARLENEAVHSRAERDRLVATLRSVMREFISVSRGGMTQAQDAAYSEARAALAGVRP